MFERLKGVKRLQDLQKDMERTEDHKHPITGEKMELEDHDRNLGQIFKNRDEQDRFMRFAGESDPDMAKGIVNDLAGGTLLTDGQDKFLEKVRIEYNLRRAEIEKVREMLTPDAVQHIADLNPLIKQMVGKISPEKAAELLSKEFELLAMSDEKAFKKVAKNLELVKRVDSNKEAQIMDQAVSEMLRKYGISDEEYAKATLSGDTPESRANIQKLITKDMGIFKKSGLAIANWTRGSSIGVALIGEAPGNRLYEGYTKQQEIIDQSNVHLKAVGRVLQATLTPEFRLAIQKATVEGGEVKEHREEDNVKSIADFRNVKNELDNRQERFDQYKAAEISRMKIKDISKQPHVTEEIKDRFATQEYEKQQKYRARGPIAALLAFLFSTGTRDDIKNSLK